MLVIWLVAPLAPLPTLAPTLVDSFIASVAYTPFKDEAC